MRRKLPLVLVMSLLASFIAGCASTSEQPSRVWPQPRPYVALYSQPEVMGSVEEAIGTIKNLQTDFVEWGAGTRFSNIDVDAYGLRVRWEWTETTQATEYVPSYSGMFIGWNYVPIYGGSYQTQTLTMQKDDLLTVPFDEVVSINLFHMPELDRNYKWGMEIWLQGNKRVAFRASSEQHLMKLHRAIYTLTTGRGVVFRRGSLGFEGAPLTSAQAHKIGIPPGNGLLVYSVARGGPAEKAGTRFLDVILEMNDVAIKSPHDVVGVLNQAHEAGKKAIAVKVLSRAVPDDVTGDQEGAKVVAGGAVERTVIMTLP